MRCLFLVVSSSLLLLNWKSLGLREGGTFNNLVYEVTRISSILKFLKEVFDFFLIFYISILLLFVIKYIQ